MSTDPFDSFTSPVLLTEEQWPREVEAAITVIAQANMAAGVGMRTLELERVRVLSALAFAERKRNMVTETFSDASWAEIGAALNIDPILAQHRYNGMGWVSKTEFSRSTGLHNRELLAVFDLNPAALWYLTFPQRGGHTLHFITDVDQCMAALKARWDSEGHHFNPALRAKYAALFPETVGKPGTKL